MRKGAERRQAGGVKYRAVFAEIFTRAAEGHQVSGEVVRVIGIGEIINGNAPAATAAAAEEFAVAAVGRDRAVAAHGSRRNPDAAARSAA
jgi:hypothetical protein